MKFWLCLIVLLAFAAPALTQTYVTENIETDTQWTVAGSPYIVQGSVGLRYSSTLTIDPGVTVKMDALAALSTQSGSSIVAIGTEGDEILFTSNSVTPAPDDWQYLYIRESSTTVFERCIFEYGRYNVYFDRSDATFSHCITRYGDSSGLYVDTCSPLIEGSNITENDRGIHMSDGSPSITGCNITDNSRGIYVDGPDANPVIHGCNIYDNSGDNMYVRDYQDLPKVIIDAESNWWGVDSYLEIHLTINIGPVYAPYVEVDVDPWLHEVPVEATSWGRLKALFAD